MKLEIKKAVRQKLKARVALLGPAGSGKTWTALQLAQGLAPGGRYLVIDTEHESAALYADVCPFDVLALESHSPEVYVQALNLAASSGYDVVIVDSLTHAWNGRDGALEQVDNKARGLKGNSYVAWRDVTPMHNALVDAMLSCPAHVIATMRVKMAYELVEGPNGKKAPQKIGLAPIQRDGLEYEFTVVCDIDTDHVLSVSKTRCAALDGKTIRKPGPEMGATLRGWLDAGVPAPKAQREQPKAVPHPTDVIRWLENAQDTSEAAAVWNDWKTLAANYTQADRDAVTAAKDAAKARLAAQSQAGAS